MAYAPSDDGSTAYDGFGEFWTPAKRILGLARVEAMRLRHLFIGAEHLLLSVLSERHSEGALSVDGPATMTLRRLGVDLRNLCRAVEQEVANVVTRRPARQTVPTLTFRASLVLEHAVFEALAEERPHVDSIDFVIGILLEGGGPAAAALHRHGVTLEDLRKEGRITRNLLLWRQRAIPSPFGRG